MPIQVIMPQLGESVDEGIVSKWLKKTGEEINEYDPLLEVNTDKVDTEIPSPGSGTLLEILVVEGTTVTAGTLLAWIGEPGEEIPEGEGIPPTTKPIEKDEKTVELAPQSETPFLPSAPGRVEGLGFISPIVAKIAREENIDLTQVKGTGQSSRITKKDVLAYLDHQRKIKVDVGTAPIHERAPAERVETQTPSKEIVPGEIIPHTIIRRSIADHMVKSKHTTPHVTTLMEVDLGHVVEHRQANKDSFSQAGVNLTYTAYFVAASVTALMAYPIVNSSWSEEGIMIHKDINIGVAVSLGETGLIVPVIKSADSLSLLGLVKTINDLALRARENKLKPHEVQKGTFTITNHGISGSLLATPIINQPQCAILGVGAIQKRVVVINDAIAIRPMAYLSLTFDHRILDGASADYFLSKLVESLEEWS
jgi:pyruvate/2-oxoglutarate dehydrogenase complex dihydrolipoamide acyltransferase (E2) component